LPAPPPRVGRSGRCSLQFLDRLRESLVATRSLLGERLQEQNGELSPEVLEEALVAADVGVTVAGELTSELVDVRRRGRIAAGGEVAWLRERIRSLLDVTARASTGGAKSCSWRETPFAPPPSSSSRSGAAVSAWR
jgi:signal recognition particle GTPase